MEETVSFYIAIGFQMKENCTTDTGNVGAFPVFFVAYYEEF